MKIIYFISGTHPYHEVIYSGVGAPFGKTEVVQRLDQVRCDIGILDNRLEPPDAAAISQFLQKPASERFLFRLSDPDMPLSGKSTIQFIFECKDQQGVHYASTYDLAGPLLEFANKLQRSRMMYLPYPYERSREVSRDIAERHRKVFLSGANDQQTLSAS